MKTIRAAAGIVQRDGEVLVVPRVHDPETWEGGPDADAAWAFPSVAVEHGEAPERACARGLEERLGMSVINVRDFYTVEYDSGRERLSMECFLCEPAPVDGTAATEDASAEPACGVGADGAQEGRWVSRSALAELVWAPEDAEVARLLSSTDPSEDERLVKRRADSRRSMQGNKRAGTKPEMLVRRCLREAGLPGYRLQWKKAPGTPDIAYPGRKVAIFVNGCYWHRCPYCHPATPKRNTEFWEAKFARNVERDAQVTSELEELGWTVIVIWECQLKPAVIDATMEKVVAQIRAATPG